MTFHFGLNASHHRFLLTSAANICQPAPQSLPFCFKKFRRGLGSVARSAWPNLWYASVCLTVWTCTSQQAFRRPLLFLPPLRWHRLVGCFSDLKCHTVTYSDAPASDKIIQGDVFTCLHWCSSLHFVVVIVQEFMMHAELRMCDAKSTLVKKKKKMKKRYLLHTFLPSTSDPQPETRLHFSSRAGCPQIE